ncbi:DUF4126 domain-containing protein, partial [Caballeronia sp. M23-90]
GCLRHRRLRRAARHHARAIRAVVVSAIDHRVPAVRRMGAAAAHLAKAGTRALINLSPEPVSNWVASATEDFGALLGITLALFVPLLCLLLIIAFLLCAGWALPR